jgi:hypothetical protein
MSNQRILTLDPYLYPSTSCWVFDDARTAGVPKDHLE